MSIRNLFAAVAVMATTVTMAQQAELLHLRTQQPMSESNLKFVIQSVVDIDPMAKVTWSDDLTIIQVRCNPSVSVEQVRAAINGAGVALQPGLVDPATLFPAPGTTEPVYIVTGDEAADKARYRAAVEAWNALHPEAPIGEPVHLLNNK
jgi:hypothetical protein